MPPKPNPILSALQAVFTPSPAQKRNPQPYHHYSGSWIPSDSAPASSSPLPLAKSEAIRLISWNIDIFAPFIQERMSAALAYLETLIGSAPQDMPTLVFLQEMGPSDMRQIREARWVQERFFLTDIDEKRWSDPRYGTAMMIDRRLRIGGVFRVPWVSRFGRDGLFVDVGVGFGKGRGEGKVLRLCDTHLESLVADPPLRPRQLETAGKLLREGNVAAALLAGDLNAIQPFDRTLHLENGLKDAYLELGGREDSDDGYTWGYQVPQAIRERFGCSRMDKILFRGAIKPSHFRRVGIDVKVAEEARQDVRDAEELEWVTDHYGVMGDFELGDWRLDVEGSDAEDMTKPKLGL